MKVRSSVITVAVLGVLSMSVAFAQSYPDRPIRIVGGSAGGGSDFIVRMLAPTVSSGLGQPIIVENRTSLTAAETGARAQPDGYTLLIGGGSMLAIPLLQAVSFDVLRDLTPISALVREINVLAVHPSVPAKSVKELIEFAKSKPAGLNFSSTGIGGPSHLAGELFKSMTGVNIVWVPYKGTSTALNAILANEVQVSIIDAGNAAPHMKTGRLRGLAVTSKDPSPLFPSLPTVAESVPGYESVVVTGIYAPTKTPTSIINRLNQEFVRAVKREEVKEALLKRDTEVLGTTPAEHLAIVKTEIARMTKVIKAASVKVQ